MDEPRGGVLYLVGTPIGNREDLSPRSARVLQQLDRLACEDTRHSAVLLGPLGIRARPISFHQHNRQQRLPKLLAWLAAGESVGLICDAGLPGINDPGEELVAAAWAAGHPVVCIPGPTAVTTALVSSGLPSGRFVFEGFLPATRSRRRRALVALAREERTLVFYEAPHRLVVFLEDVLELWGDRPLRVARELTKYHEEQVGPTAAAALAHFRGQTPRGECCVVVAGAPAFSDASPAGDELLASLRALIETEGLSPSRAARALAARTGQSRQAIYALLHGAGGLGADQGDDNTGEPDGNPAGGVEPGTSAGMKGSGV